MGTYPHDLEIKTKFYRRSSTLKLSESFNEDSRQWISRLRLEYFDEDKSNWEVKGGFDSSGYSGENLSAPCDYGTLTYGRVKTTGGWWDEHLTHTITFEASNPRNMPPGMYRVQVHLLENNTPLGSDSYWYITFYIHDQYGIEYQANGDNVSALPSQVVAEATTTHLNATLDLAPNTQVPKRAGYTFLGWEIDGVRYQSGASISFTEYGFKTANAIWARAVKIYYESQALFVTTPEDQIVYAVGASEEVNLAGAPELTDAQREMGWEFVAWRVASQDIAPNGTVNLSPGDYTALAVWRISWTYDLAGGNINGNGSDVTYSTLVTTNTVSTATQTKPTKRGYKFVAWVDDQETVITDFDLSQHSGPIKFFAKWSRLADAVRLVFAEVNNQTTVTPEYVQDNTIDAVAPELTTVNIQIDGPLTPTNIQGTYGMAIAISRRNEDWSTNEQNYADITVTTLDGSDLRFQLRIYIYKVLNGALNTVKFCKLTDTDSPQEFGALALPPSYENNAYNALGWNASDALEGGTSDTILSEQQSKLRLGEDYITSLTVPRGQYATRLYPVYARYTYSIRYELVRPQTELADNNPTFSRYVIAATEPTKTYTITSNIPLAKTLDRTENTTRLWGFTGWVLGDNEQEILSGGDILTLAPDVEYVLKATWIQYPHRLFKEGSSDPTVTYNDSEQNKCTILSSELPTLPVGAHAWSVDDEPITLTGGRFTVNTQDCTLKPVYSEVYTVTTHDVMSTAEGELILTDSTREDTITEGQRYQIPGAKISPATVTIYTNAREYVYSWTYIGYSSSPTGEVFEPGAQIEVTQDLVLYPRYEVHVSCRAKAVIKYAGGGAYDTQDAQGNPIYYYQRSICEQFTGYTEWAVLQTQEQYSVNKWSYVLTDLQAQTINIVLSSAPAWPGTLTGKFIPRFKCWVKDATEYDAEDHIQVQEGTHTFVARWEVQYGLRYEVSTALSESLTSIVGWTENENGTGYYKEVSSGDTYVSQNPDYTWPTVSVSIGEDEQQVQKENWDITAWARIRTDNTSTEQYHYLETISVTAGEQVTLYPFGQKQIKYTLIYKAKFFAQDQSETVYHSKEWYEFTLISATAPTGYIFLGWAETESNNTVVKSAGTEYKVTVNNRQDKTVTLYAVVKPVYTVHTEYRDWENNTLSEYNDVGVPSLIGEAVAYSKFGVHETSTKTLTISELPILSGSRVQGWEYGENTYAMNSSPEVRLTVDRYNPGTYTLVFKEKLVEKLTISLVITRPAAADDSEVTVETINKTESVSTPTFVDNTLSDRFEGKPYHPVTYTVSKDVGEDSTVYPWSGGIEYNLDSQATHFTITIHTAYNQFHITMDRGSNSKATGPWTSNVEYYVKSDNTIGTRFYEADDADTNILTLVHLTGQSVADQLQSGGYQFSGLAHTLTGDIVYSVSQSLPAITDGLQHISNGGIVTLYAKWGVGVASYETSYSVNGHRLTVELRLFPENAADMTVIPKQTVNGGETRITEFSGAPQLVSNTIKGNLVTIVLDYLTDPVLADELIFDVVGKVNGVTNPRIYTRYAIVEFVNDSDGALNMMLPSPIYYLTYAETANQLTGETIPLYYSAVANGLEYTFAGWTTVRDAFNTIQQVSSVSEVNVGEYDSIQEDYVGGRIQLYPLWKMVVKFDLNGGNWPANVTQENIEYAGTYTGLHNEEPVQITGIPNPVHPTKQFIDWNKSLDLIREVGSITISAVWKVRNMTWTWGKGYIEVIGPKNGVNLSSDPNDPIQVCTVYSPTYTWETDPQSSICFNTEENMPSHVLIDGFEPNMAEEYAYITLTAGRNAPVIVWSAYAKPINGVVTIDASQLPQIVYKIVNDEEVDIPNPLYWHIPKENPNTFTLIPKVSGYLQVPASIGETTEIFIRKGYVEHEYEEENEDTHPVEGVRYVFNNISTTVPQGFGFAGAWTIVSNDTGYTLAMNISEPIGSAETYALDKDTYGTYFFRRIYENWIRATTVWYNSVDIDSGGYTETINKYGELRISDRAPAGPYAAIFRTYPGGEEHIHVVLVKIVDKDIDAPLCKLTKRTSPNSATDEVLYLSNPSQKNISISSIKWNRKARLVQSPILTKSSQFNYIIDTGNLEYLSFTITRTQPEEIDDSPHCYDQAKWSNKYWLEKVKAYFDQWQNANYNKDGRRSGGYNLVFDPLIGYKNFPKLDKNVFLASPLDIRYGRSVSIGFQFLTATMLGRNATDPKYAYFQYETEPVPGESEGTIKKITVEYYADLLIAPDIPSDAKAHTITWSLTLPDSSGNPVTHYFEPGSEVIGQIASVAYDESRQAFVQGASPTFEAVIGTNIGTILVLDTARDWTITADAIGRAFGIQNTQKVWVTCTAVGGGGGGGPSEAYVAVDNRDKPWLSEYYIGGGGGSGHKDTKSRRVVGPQAMYVSLGKGGASGKDGGATTVSLGGFNLIHVNGGGAGQMKAAGKGDAKGGENTSFAHWTLRRWGENQDIKGSNGEPNANREENVSGVYLIGGAGSSSLDGATPGSGGGATNLKPVVLPVGSRYYIPSYEVQGDLTAIDVTSEDFIIRSEGGSMTNVGTDLNNSSARYGGGGCSKLVKPEHNSTMSFINSGVSLLRAAANGVLAIASGGVQYLKGWALPGTTIQTDNDILEDVGNPGVSFVRFGSEGNAGADGFVVIEFNTLPEDTPVEVEL